MNKEELFYEFGNIDKRFILNAAPKEKKKFGVGSLFVVAACLCLTVCAVVSIVHFHKEGASIPDLDGVIWSQWPCDDTYGWGVEGEDGEDVFVRWDIALAYEHDGYLMSSMTFVSLRDAEADDVFGMLVTDREKGACGEDEMADMFSNMGIPALIRDGELFIFPKKTEFLQMELAKEYKENLVFSLVSRSYFEQR